jgi:hypothetical protein
MSKQKKPSARPKTHVIRIPLPPQKQQRASATSSRNKRQRPADVPSVQQTLFDLDQGGAR